MAPVARLTTRDPGGRARRTADPGPANVGISAVSRSLTRRFVESGEEFGNLLLGPERWPSAHKAGDRRRSLGYGVIGNTADSGSAILGSSPGTPAEVRPIWSPSISTLSWLSFHSRYEMHRHEVHRYE